MPDRIRVLIVDDSAFMRLAVDRMLRELEQVEVVGTATNGEEGVNLAKTLHPDVVIMDVNMPRMDGLQALERIMAEAPTNVLMLSTLTREGAETTLRALELGAVDFLDKAAAGTSMDIYTIGPQLREKVLCVADAHYPEAIDEKELEVVEQKTDRAAPIVKTDFEVFVIGASTGGPRALSELLCRLPTEFPVGIVIAQHMPPGFTETLAERLDRNCALRVLEAADGMKVEGGKVLLAPGGKQTILQRVNGELRVRVDRGAADEVYRPSVNLLFESAARNVGRRAIGLVLTGMGDDGAEGMKALHECGAPTVTESEDSAVIFGMPRVAAASADKVLALKEIGPAIAELARNGGWEDDG